MNAQDAWSAAYHQLELQFDRATFDTWVRGAALLQVEEATGNITFVVGVRNTYARDMLQHRLYRNIRRVLSDAYGTPVELRFEAMKPVAATPADGDGEMPLFKLLAQQEADETESAHNGGSVPALHRQMARPQRPELPESELNPRYTFDRFVAGGENQMVYAAARAVAEQPAAGYNPLFIHGGVGVGKTHLLQAIAHAAKAKGLKIVYIPSEVFTNDLVDAIRNKTTAMFRERYRTADVLIVDDIQFISGKETTQEEFFHTFNTLYTYNKQIVLASDRPPRDMATLAERLRSRFEGGLVIDMQPPSYETRIAILKNWAIERGLNVPMDVLYQIADRVQTHARELEGVFNHMIVTFQLTGRHTTPGMADDLLANFQRPRHTITLQRVLEVVARHHGLTENDLIGPRRNGPVNLARQIAMYLSRELTNASLPQIGEVFGGRKHSTVIYACRAIDEIVHEDALIAAMVEDIRCRLTGDRE